MASLDLFLLLWKVWCHSATLLLLTMLAILNVNDNSNFKSFFSHSLFSSSVKHGINEKSDPALIQLKSRADWKKGR